MDLFCKAGGASKGYADAGFEVIGVDIEPQPNYPFEFHQADVNDSREYPALIEPTRQRLESTGLPYVIENVVGAPLLAPIRRHRLFEIHEFTPALILPCAHHWQQDRIYPALNGHDRNAGRRSGIMGVYGNGGDKRADLWPEAMGIDWMSRHELTQAIPPAYTEWLGTQLLAHIANTPKIFSPISNDTTEIPTMSAGAP